jgi:hypothetical protein
MKYLHYEFNLTSDDAIKVELKNQANVKLVDSLNYNNYRNGRKYTYYGGRAVKSPVILNPPYSGHWHLVIDLGGYSGSIAASVTLLNG